MRAASFYTCRRRDVWAPVSGWPYWVSTTGKIKSVPRIVRGRDGRTMRVRSRILKPQRSRRLGYWTVSLHLNRRAKTFYVHDLVASAFIGKRPEGFDVNHVDGCKTNAWVGNLEYATRSENCRHARDHRLVVRKLTPDTAAAIRDRLRRGDTRKTVASDYGVTASLVGMIERGQAWN